jgi:hypothetical protein
MIVFDLACECGFSFEGWFKDHDDFVNQERDGLLICPRCGGRNCLRKILSPVTFRKNAVTCSVPRNPEADAGAAPITAAAEQVNNALREFVENNFEDVGAEFARKSLKIHYGVEEAKNIRGVATPDEEKMLDKEGVRFVKIPILVKKENQ